MAPHDPSPRPAQALLLVSMLCGLVACAGRPRASIEVPRTERGGYEGASGFVPPGTESLLMIDVQQSLGMLGKLPAALDPDGPLHFVYAGRDFGIPHRQGFGPAVHLLAYDPGPRGVAPESMPQEDQVEVAEVERDGDRVLWRRILDDDPTNPFAQPWAAVVGGRFLLEASSDELCRAAIAARDAGLRYLPLHLPVELDWTSPILLIRRLDSQADPAEGADGTSTLALLAGFCLVARPSPDGLEGLLWVHGTDPEKSRYYFSQRYGLAIESGFVQRAPHWWSTPVRVRLGEPVPRGRRLLYLLSLAGLKILVEPTAG